MGGPLQGITMLDFSAWGVGPYAGMLLATLGAKVVKVDPPEGDGITYLPPFLKGASLIYLAVNAYKRNIKLDLKSPEGVDTAYELVRHADVFLENMSLGTIERLGLGYDKVSQINPRIIYASSTPFGRTGPMARFVAIDPIVQAFSGWCSITGSPGGQWEMFRQQGHLDLNTSVHIAAGILQALILRQRDGKGRRVDLTMLGCALKLQSSRLAEFFATGQQPPLLGSTAATTAPHAVFQCRDKFWLTVGVTSQAQWRRFCLALNNPQLADDPRFATNQDRVSHRDELHALLEETFASKNYRWWETQFTRYRVPHGRPLDFATMRLHEEMRRYLPVIDHPKYGTYHWGAVPIHYEATPIDPPWIQADPLGASTTPEELLRELAPREV